MKAPNFPQMSMRSLCTILYLGCCLFISLTIIVSCSKDTDSFRDAVLVNEDIAIENPDSVAEAEEEPQEENQEETDPIIEKLESRTTIFSAIEDAYLQNGIGYDGDIIRLQENFRTSYIMFDLGQIDSVDGRIIAVNLEFIIDTDDGDGEIEVYIGDSNEWTESTLSQDAAPDAQNLLGEISKQYLIHSKTTIALDTARVKRGVSTFILKHKSGNDLAFASKENTNRAGPKLVVTYEVSETAKLIVVEDEQDLDATAEEETTEEETTEEETTEEETTEEETTEEETTEEETTEEETTEEETTEEVTNSAPTAIASATSLSGTVPLEVTFTGDKSTDDKGIVSYLWNFPNGTSTKVTETLTFTVPGTYEIALTVKDAEGLAAVDTITVTVNPKNNEAPIAKASADVLAGTAPLVVNFKGDTSSDDTAVTRYAWDFKDGSSATSPNPSHTFEAPGTYDVILTVYDAAGLSSTAEVTIIVNAPANEAPKAVASANISSGFAPLQVNFTGSNSSDDQAITSYLWKFKDGSESDLANPSHTFNTPGIYYVDLFVIDAQGLSDFAGVTITVEEEITTDTSCVTNGGKANETGLKTWCWGDVPVSNGVPGNNEFSNRQLSVSAECNPNLVTNSGNRLRFSLNPTSPAPQSWCNNNFNMRAEINTQPWNVDHPSGTEEWIGWSYTFGDSYKVDTANSWIFYQAHEGTVSENPLLSLQVNGRQGNLEDGEIMIVNSTHQEANNLYYGTGIVPVAGETINIVLHVIWGNDNTGLLQVWMNGIKVHDEQERTILSSTNVGGNSKWGIYHSPWRNQSGVNVSANQGIINLETFMGPLRMITRKPGDAEYGNYSYDMVAPN